MGFIRGGLLIIAGVLLFLLFLAGNSFLTLSLSLNYENIEPELFSVIETFVEDEADIKEEIENQYPFMEDFCQNNSEFVFNSKEVGQVFVIPCDVVFQGYDSILEYSIESYVEKIYYQEYDCGFWDCLGKADIPFFLISAKAKSYWNNKFYFSLIISVVLVALMFFLVEKKTNLLVIVGGLLAISALPFMKINWALSFFNKSFLQFFTIFFSKAYSVFLISFIFGIVLLGIGILLKFVGVGLWISNLFNRKNKSFKD